MAVIELIKLLIVVIPWKVRRCRAAPSPDQGARGLGSVALGVLHSEPWTVAAYLLLALIYAVNNNITFYAMDVTDPATFNLFRTVAPFATALMLKAAFGASITQLQWVCIVQAVRMALPSPV